MSKLDIPFGRPWITDAERAAVMEVLNGNILTHGPNCKGFEQGFVEMMGGGHAITTSSCMASLHLSWINLGIGPDDEVLLPSTTHVATAHAVELTRATPVFCDSDPQTGNMRLDEIEAKITNKTKAIGLVHYIGIPMDMAAVMGIAEQHGLAVVEDCALAVGSRVDGKHVGLFGHTGSYSFYPVKHITCGEGGMLVSKDEAVLRDIANFRAFHYDKSQPAPKPPGLYDVDGVGMNYRMSEMQAALGRVQLEKVPEILERRRRNFEVLRDGLNALPQIRVLDSIEPRLTSSHYCVIMVLEGDLAARRDQLALELNGTGVGTSIYYPHPIGRLTYYRKKYGYNPLDFSVAEMMADHTIALPCGPHLISNDLTEIIEAVATVTRN